MRYAIVILAVLVASVLAGCATTARTEFITEEGASFSSVSKAGPMGTLDTANQNAVYRLLPDGTWELVVGQTAQGLDNSGQATLLESLLRIGLKIGEEGLAAGVPLE